MYVLFVWEFLSFVHLLYIPAQNSKAPIGIVILKNAYH